jgi:serine/threonine protein kinase
MLRKHLIALHDRNIYHGDVKLDNIMLCFKDAFIIERLYLVDFATSSFFNKEDPTHRTVPVTSDSFSSPESCTGMYRSSKRDDVWGFLACLFVWLSEGTPMYNTSDNIWFKEFVLWYQHGSPAYWDQLLVAGMFKFRTVELLQCWFTDLKNLEREAFLPSEEDIRYLFDA